MIVELKSNMDAMLVAIPMVVLLGAGFFRLDVWVIKPKKHSMRHTLAGGIDKNGFPIGMDPDGKPLGHTRIRN